MVPRGSLWLRWCVLTLACGLSAAAFAQSDSESVIKYRQGSMKALGGHMGALSQIVRGKVHYEDQLLLHAQAVAGLSKVIPTLFPKGSDFGETHAKDAVWDKPDEFKAAADKEDKAAAAFLDAVHRGDEAAVQSSFKDLGEACKSCHKRFREKD